MRRKTVLMFAEGSILRSPLGSQVIGNLANVTPKIMCAHQVYRYGLSLVAGCYDREDEDE